MKPIIGIVSRPGISKFKEKVQSIEENYKNAVLESGGIPICILPPQSYIFAGCSTNAIPPLTDSEKEDLDQVLTLCDGFIVPGGIRVYDYDFYICKYAKENNIPILGICAGHQTMAKIDNNMLNNELIPEENHNLDNGSTHSIKLNKDTLLYSILNQDSIDVNSYHRYRIISSGPYVVGATADNCIESIEYSDNDFYLGVQWHPERSFNTDNNSKLIFKRFIDSTKKDS